MNKKFKKSSQSCFLFFLLVGGGIGSLDTAEAHEHQAQKASSKKKTRQKLPNFSELIKKDFFQVKPSKSNLKELHQASTVILTCIDFRLRDETEQLMDKHFHMRDDYDEVVIPGASLGLVYKEKPNWTSTEKEVIGLAQKLHGVKRVLFIDHRGCGAYNLAKGTEHAQTRETETATHRQVMLEAKEELKKSFPDLEVHGLLMGLDGRVDNLKI